MTNPQTPYDLPQAPPLAYAIPLSVRRRPGLVTAIGIISIIVASLSMISSVTTGFDAVGIYWMTRMSSAVARGGTPVPNASMSTSAYSSTSSPNFTGSASTQTSTSMPSTTLTATDVATILQSAQQASGNRMTQVQLNSLSTILNNPSQQLVTSTTAANAVTSASVYGNGYANVVLSDGSVSIDPQGQITTFPFSANAGAMPNFKASPVACALSIADALLSLGLAVFLLIGGILVLRGSGRGRRMHMTYAILKIPLAVAGSAAVGWMLSDFYSSLFSSIPGGAGPAGMMQGMGIIVAFGMAIPALIYPIALLIVLNTRGVREYFNSVTR